MARKLQTVEIQLPFAGFYNSIYSDAIDRQEESFIEWRCEENNGDSDSELCWPEALRLSADKLQSILFDVTSYRDAYRALAESYVDAFSELAGEALGISAPELVKRWDYDARRMVKTRRMVDSLRLTFAAMESPREYNFQTDRVFANIPVSVVAKLWAISRAEGHVTLSRVASERHSGRDGFISFYSSDISDWGPVKTWDHNQLETLLIAACEIAGFDWQDSDLGIYYAATDSEADYQAWDSAVDWQAFDVKRLEARAELYAAWLESDPDSASAWASHHAAESDSLVNADPGLFTGATEVLENVPYRCMKTRDMFAPGNSI